jgi:hypothetical protein
MARLLPASLGKRAITSATLLAALLASAVLRAQTPNSYILAVRRSGAIEIIDPASLTTLGRIHFDFPPKSSGLNGVSASADGTMLYVEGPAPSGPAAGGCCVLYSIDLATMETRQVADEPGTSSRRAFATSNGVTHRLPATNRGVPRSPGGIVVVYDPAQASVLQDAAPPGLGQPSRPNGIWMGDRFLFYATKDDGSAARLWSVSPDASQLGEALSVEPFTKVPGCSSSAETGLATAAGNLFIYETFGWKLDRRTRCSGVPGGAWVLDPATGTLLAHIAGNFYFSELVADRETGELYGLSLDDPNWRSGVKLVRIDAEDGTVLQSRLLEPDFWRIAYAPLRVFPAADVRALIFSRK